MKTAVVILNWNGEDFLKRFIPGVCRYSAGEGRQVVVADNGSTDGSLAWLAENHPEVRQVVLGQNYGFAEGYNRALSEIKADYYLLLNSDVEVTEGWIDPLEQRLDSTPNAAAVMPKICSYTEPGRFEYAGAAGGFIDFLGYPFCRGRVLQAVEYDRGQYDRAEEVFWASGACMLVRASLFRAQGGFDASFFAHQEEIDLCWRWKLAGHTVWVEPASVVYHVGGGTLSADNPRKTYLNFRNNLFMLYKNLSQRSLHPVLALRLLLDGASALMFLLQGKPQLLRAVWHAHRDFFRQRKVLKIKRIAVKQTRIARPSGIYPGSIVWRYFTGRKISPYR
ncbi:MAG: glycosyltransferase family 2 protein [Rikenellaceae bacterium]|nr:glycosyltransferase family 2 protein [Rikenellaceae bacterium]